MLELDAPMAELGALAGIVPSISVPPAMIVGPLCQMALPDTVSVPLPSLVKRAAAASQGRSPVTLWPLVSTREFWPAAVLKRLE